MPYEFWLLLFGSFAIGQVLSSFGPAWDNAAGGFTFFGLLLVIGLVIYWLGNIPLSSMTP